MVVVIRMGKAPVLCWEMPERCALNQTTKLFAFIHLGCIVTARITQSAGKVLPHRSRLRVSLPLVVRGCAPCSCPDPAEQGMKNRWAGPPAMIYNGETGSKRKWCCRVSFFSGGKLNPWCPGLCFCPEWGPHAQPCRGTGEVAPTY